VSVSITFGPPRVKKQSSVGIAGKLAILGKGLGNEQSPGDSAFTPTSGGGENSMLAEVSRQLMTSFKKERKDFMDQSDGQQTFRIMVALLHKKFKNCVERNERIHQEIQKIVSD